MDPQEVVQLGGVTSEYLPTASTDLPMSEPNVMEDRVVYLEGKMGQVQQFLAGSVSLETLQQEISRQAEVIANLQIGIGTTDTATTSIPGGALTRSTKLRLPNLPIYDGARTDDGCYDWIRAAKNYMAADVQLRQGEIAPAAAVTFLSTYLQKDALTWWMNLVDSASRSLPGMVVPTSMESLFQLMEIHFTPLDLNNRLKQEWKKLKQGGRSVNEFQTDFNRLINRLRPVPSNHEQCERVRDGLDSWLFRRVEETLQTGLNAGSFVTVVSAGGELVGQLKNIFEESPILLFQTAARLEGIDLENKSRRKDAGVAKYRSAQGQINAAQASPSKPLKDYSKLQCYTCQAIGHISPHCPRNEGSNNTRGRGGRGRGRGRGGRGRGRGQLKAIMPPPLYPVLPRSSVLVTKN